MPKVNGRRPFSIQIRRPEYTQLFDNQIIKPRHGIYIVPGKEQHMRQILTTLVVLTTVTGFGQTTTRRVSDFHSIKIQGPFDVYITQGDSESVTLNAPEEILSRMVTAVEGGVLKVHPRHDNWSQGPKSWYGDKSWWHTHPRISVYITTKSLRRLVSSGSTAIQFKEGINTDHLKIVVRGSGHVEGKVSAMALKTKVSGSGHVALAGTAKKASIRIFGSGEFSGKDLATTDAAVHISGSGHAAVNASNQVNAALHGSAGISYTGTDNIHTRKSGSGSVSKL
jgi:hypothetical protein